MVPFRIKKGLGRGLSSLIGDTKVNSNVNKLSVSDVQKISKLKTEDIENLFQMQNIKQTKSQHMREIPHGWIPNISK